MPFQSSYLHRQPVGALLRSLLVFRLCRLPLVIQNARPLLAGLQAVPLLGPPLSAALLRRTFFAQFVGGESEAELAPRVAALAKEGVGSILDYAAEADEAGGGAAAADPAAASAAHSEACLRLSQQSVASAAHTGGFAAVKVTGIASPELLKAVTLRMHEHRRAFRALALQLAPAPAPADSARAASSSAEGEAAPLYLEARLTREGFLAALAARSPSAPPAALQGLWALCSARARGGSVDYLDFVDAARLLGLGQQPLAQAAAAACGLPTPEAALALLLGADSSSSSSSSQGALTPLQRAEWAAALGRLAALCTTAHTLGVSLMVDAEQTYLQGAIDLAVVTMQRTFNSPAALARAAGALSAGNAPPPLLPEELHVLSLAGGAAAAAAAPAAAAAAAAAPTPTPTPTIIPVFNTYQAYLRDTPSRLALAIARAEREGWALGVKLVRGAYMRQERERAQQLRYHDPIWPDIAGTHGSYEACVQQLLRVAKAQRGAFMVASHNTLSCQRVAEEVKAWQRGGAGAGAGAAELLRRARCAGGVSFGQLLGMSDALTFSLAATGLPAFKYMPYGPLREVTPYLLRRGEENSDLLTSNVAAEIASLQGELLARVLGRRQ